MLKRVGFNLLVIAIMVISCNTYDLPSGTPQCIKDRISEFEKAHNCENISVERYTYQGKSYYAFVEPCCCDIPSIWYDSECNQVCMTGTIGGTINCSIPIDELDFREVIWEN